MTADVLKLRLSKLLHIATLSNEPTTKIAVECIDEGEMQDYIKNLPKAGAVVENIVFVIEDTGMFDYRGELVIDAREEGP